MSSDVGLAVLNFALRFEGFSLYPDTQGELSHSLYVVCGPEHVCLCVQAHKRLLRTAKHTGVSQSLEPACWKCLWP